MNEDHRTIIIAEIGECYNGDMQIARELIREAKKSGCDIVKFQTLDYENISKNDPEKDWFNKVALDPEKIDTLVKYAKELNIDILFTPENVKTAKWIIEAGIREVKIASSTIIDKELIRFINTEFDKVFLSTGMASLDEITSAVENLSDIVELFILHCISEYPTGPLLEQRGLKPLNLSDTNFNMMKILMALFPNVKIGYSDHTDGILAPIVAVAAGAKVIEKHITLDRETPLRNFMTGKEYLGTDHILSIEPSELRDMVKQIRIVEKMFGKWKWERTDGEKILKNFLRNRFMDE